MRKMIVFCSVGYCGMDSAEPLLVADDATQKEIDEQAWQIALDNAEMYGYYPPQYDGDDDSDYVSEDIEGSAVDYDPEKHDCQRSGGGSFEEDFASMIS